MFKVTGSYNTAHVFSSVPLEAGAHAQILAFVNDPAFAGVRIAVMPDAHAGVGCVVGFTSEVSDKVVPNVVGVDQGCGVIGWKLGKRLSVEERYEPLDTFIRASIPHGRAVREKPFDAARLGKLFGDAFRRSDSAEWLDRVVAAARQTEQQADYVLRSLGTLGGGNHFIEIDIDEEDALWLVVHSGSRNFGLKCCRWHQNRAESRMRRSGRKSTGLEYLEGERAQHYYEHLHVAQVYAQMSRRIMGLVIIEDFFGLAYGDLEVVESVHNYVDFGDRVLRKGAISAHAGQPVIIPLNMADGTVIGVGKGNRDWNNSAPHGAGRRMSRHEARRRIDLAEYQRIMHDRKVWTSCVGKDTLDEAPQAYKKADTILQDIKEAVEITHRLRPTYNFKASE